MIWSRIEPLKAKRSQMIWQPLSITWSKREARTELWSSIAHIQSNSSTSSNIIILWVNSRLNQIISKNRSWVRKARISLPVRSTSNFKELWSSRQNEDWPRRNARCKRWTLWADSKIRRTRSRKRLTSCKSSEFKRKSVTTISHHAPSWTRKKSDSQWLSKKSRSSWKLCIRLCEPKYPHCRFRCPRRIILKTNRLRQISLTALPTSYKDQWQPDLHYRATLRVELSLRCIKIIHQKRCSKLKDLNNSCKLQEILDRKGVPKIRTCWSFLTPKLAEISKIRQMKIPFKKTCFCWGRVPAHNLRSARVIRNLNTFLSPCWGEVAESCFQKSHKRRLKKGAPQSDLHNLSAAIISRRPNLRCRWDSQVRVVSLHSHNQEERAGTMLVEYTRFTIEREKWLKKE